MNPSFRKFQIGKVFNKLLASRVVFERNFPIWKLYYDRDCMNSLEQQSLGTVIIGKEEQTAMIKQSSSMTKNSSSKIVIYHNGSEIYVELSFKVDSSFQLMMKDNPPVFKMLSAAIRHDDQSVDLTDEQQTDEDVCRFFTLLNSTDVVTLIQPNYTEIFEGTVKKVLTSSSSEKDYYSALSRWIALDSIAGSLHLSIIRARYLILSKLGEIAGYFIRLEVYEERFGEIQILVFGLNNQRSSSSSPSTTISSSPPSSIIYQLKVSKSDASKLLHNCDEILEKDKLEASDSVAMAYIFTDRLRITPSHNWFNFLSSGALLPRTISVPLSLSTRLKKGAGRLVGSRLLNLRNMFLTPPPLSSSCSCSSDSSDSCFSNDNKKLLVLLTIFEINSPRTYHDLRIVLYHFYSSKSVEYRISSMERLMLFKDNNISIINQIIERLRLSFYHYPLTNYDKRVFLHIYELNPLKDVEKFPQVLNIKEYEVNLRQNEREFQILTEISKGDIEEEEDNDDGDEAEVKHQTNLHRSSSALDVEGKTNDDWGFILYFDRSCLHEIHRNLIVSVILEINLKGFVYIIYDPRTFMEVSRFFPFLQIYSLLGKSVEDLDDDLTNLDESVAYDVIEDALTLIDFEEHTEEGLILYLDKSNQISSPETNRITRDINEGRENHSNSGSSCSREEESEEDTEVIVLARLKELSEEVGLHPKASKRAPQLSYRIFLEIIKCSNLSRLGAFGARNPFCVVRYNNREISRTSIIKNTLSPIFPTNLFTIHVNNQQSLLNSTSSIEIEVYDSDAKGKTTDYLGNVKLAGEALFNFLNHCTTLVNNSNDDNSEGKDKKEKKEKISDKEKEDDLRGMTFDLQKSKKLSDYDNKHVKGSITLHATMKEINSDSENDKKDTVVTSLLAVAKTADSTSALGSADSSFEGKIYSEVLLRYKRFGFFLYSYEIFNLRDIVASSIDQNQLSVNSSLCLVVYFNLFEIFRFSLKNDFSSSSVIDYNIPVEFRLLENYPLSSCKIIFSFYCVKQFRLELLGTASLCGVSLVKILQPLFSSSLPPASPLTTVDLDILMKSNNALEAYSNEISSSLEMKVGKLSVCPTLWKTLPEAFKLIIRSGRNLPKADLFGKR
jgi:hypothetical protein